MATAEELLAGSSTVDKTLVISNDLRQIIIPSSVTNLGVEYDDDVLRLEFKMPRYVSDTDLSTFPIRINYINSQGESDVYTVRDTNVGAQYITFSWLVGPTATRYKGDTKFNVCLKKLASDGVTVDKEYNTTVATLPVLEGLEVEESVVTAYTDIIEQWRRELFGIGDTEEASIKAVSQNEQKAIENKGTEVLATIPVDYQTAVSMTDNAERTKADAIICSTQGDPIVISDSSDDYLRGLKIFGKTTQASTTGKNLFSAGLEYGLWTFSLKTKTGNNNYIKSSALVKVTPGKTYRFSGTAIKQYQGNLAFYNVDGEYTGDDKQLYGFDIFTAPDNAHYIAFHILASFANDINGTIQMEEGTSSTEYEPYSGGFASPSPYWAQPLNDVENPTVEIYGKNLLNADMLVGGSFVKDDDGYTFTKLENTATSATCSLNLPAGDYVLSWGEIERTAESYRVYINHADGTQQLTGLTNLGSNRLRISAPSGIKDIRLSLASNVTTDTYVKFAWLQLEVGTEVTEYEPYAKKQSFAPEYIIRAIPVSENGNYTDENGKQWICDEIDFERGVHIQRTKTITFNGTESWYISAAQYSSGTRFDVNISNVSAALSQDVLCDRFVFKGANAGVETTWVLPDTAGFRIITEVASTVDELTQFLTDNPTTIIYAIKTPIETPLTAEEIQWFRFAHTNCPTSTVLNDAGATMELKYNADTTTFLRNCAKPTDEQIQNAVNAWLDAHYSSAEGAKF